MNGPRQATRKRPTARKTAQWAHKRIAGVEGDVVMAMDLALGVVSVLKGRMEELQAWLDTPWWRYKPARPPRVAFTEKDVNRATMAVKAARERALAAAGRAGLNGGAREG